ncbi:MAG: pantetheine-phosphate adenylyltransferase [Candidatus Omnitrophica bacterium]|nr:pantetheine-phosphate adenylyltransferase [Candidatus Omnitrophota bacterium]
MCQKAVYPGSFDPLTYGHLDIIKRAKEIFSELTIAVAKNPTKPTLFSFRERIQMVKEVTKDMEGITVEGFNGLIVDYCRQKKIKVIIRGLRMISDFEHEFQMALTNRKLSKENIEIVFLMTHESYSYISSKLIKEIASFGGKLSEFVPPFVERKIKEKLKNADINKTDSSRRNYASG